MTIHIDIIDGNTAKKTWQGWEFTRIATVTGVTGAVYYTFPEAREGRAVVHADKFGHTQGVSPTLMKNPAWVAVSSSLYCYYVG